MKRERRKRDRDGVPRYVTENGQVDWGDAEGRRRDGRVTLVPSLVRTRPACVSRRLRNRPVEVCETNKRDRDEENEKKERSTQQSKENEKTRQNERMRE